jgi:hypothetical protein
LCVVLGNVEADFFVVSFFFVIRGLVSVRPTGEPGQQPSAALTAHV